MECHTTSECISHYDILHTVINEKIGLACALRPVGVITVYFIRLGECKHNGF